MVSSRSVNHPFGRNHVFVCTADAGIRKNEAKPMRRVISPSRRKIHLHPAMPLTPSRWKIAKARSDVTIPVTLRDVQKKLRRIGSSRLV
jgi:hypothetical protein